MVQISQFFLLLKSKKYLNLLFFMACGKNYFYHLKFCEKCSVDHQSQTENKTNQFYNLRKNTHSQKKCSFI